VIQQIHLFVKHSMIKRSGVVRILCDLKNKNNGCLLFLLMINTAFYTAINQSFEQYKILKLNKQ